MTYKSRGNPHCRHLVFNRTGTGWAIRPVSEELKKTCATAFGIFQHGGFGNAHVLGVITLVVLGIAAVAGQSHLFGRASRSVETVGYSATFFFHCIPAITETSTRLPPASPLVANADAPALQMATGVLFVAFLVGATLQVRRLRAAVSPTR